MIVVVDTRDDCHRSRHTHTTRQPAGRISRLCGRSSELGIVGCCDEAVKRTILSARRDERDTSTNLIGGLECAVLRHYKKRKNCVRRRQLLSSSVGRSATSLNSAARLLEATSSSSDDDDKKRDFRCMLSCGAIRRLRGAGSVRRRAVQTTRQSRRRRRCRRVCDARHQDSTFFACRQGTTKMQIVAR